MRPLGRKAPVHVNVTVSMPVAMRDALTAHATAKSRSLAWLVRSVLDEYLAERVRENDHGKAH